LNSFYYIAGCTEGSYPYGVTYEEAEKAGILEEENQNLNKASKADDDLPF